MSNVEQDERAAICEFDGGLPRKWAEVVARLSLMEKPKDYLDERWKIIRDDVCLLLDRWHKAIDGNGWNEGDVKRLALELSGRPVVSVGMADVTVMNRAGNKSKIFYRPNPGGTARWDDKKRRG